MNPIQYFQLFTLIIIFVVSSENSAEPMLCLKFEVYNIGAEAFINENLLVECLFDIQKQKFTNNPLLKQCDLFHDYIFPKITSIGNGVVNDTDATIPKRVNLEEQKHEDELLSVDTQHHVEESTQLEAAQNVQIESDFNACREIYPKMIKIPGRNYEIGKFLVTQSEWEEVMGSNPSHFDNCGDNCPVENVSWDNIQIFFQKLNVICDSKFRLPTEAEWEYACYGGSETEFCGGSNLDAVGWYKDNSGGQTHPVGQKQANGFGLYDMTGNVWQWMENKYDNEHEWRALRGGSWNDYTNDARADNRDDGIPADTDEEYGFRVARKLP